MSHSALSDLSYSSPFNRRPTSYDSYYDETDTSDRSEVSDVFADIGILIPTPTYRSDDSYVSFESEHSEESSSFDDQGEMYEYSERSDEVSDIFGELYQEFANASCSTYKDSEGYDFEDSKMEDDDDCSELPAERGYY